MRIIDFEIHKYTRLAYSAIETIRYRPEQDVQIIIGSNGCGKSSLLDELNILPPDKNFMLDGGYKKIHVEHRGMNYTALYTFGKHRKCSLIEHNPDKGDVELNEGGTTVAQKMVIERIFGVDVNLMKIIIGRTRFTRLAPIKRREWILKLSGSDLDYAMAVYNRVKSETNDAKSVEKHYVKRLAGEMGDKIEQAKIEELENDVASLTSGLNRLMEQKDNSVPSLHFLKSEIARAHETFDTVTSEALNIRLYKPSFVPEDIYDLKDLWGFMQTLGEKKRGLETKLSELYEQKSSVDEALDVMRQSGVSDTSQLVEVNKGLQLEREELIKLTPLFDAFKDENPHAIQGRYLSCKDVLIDSLTVLPDNSEQRWTREYATLARDKLQGYTARAARLTEEMKELEHRLNYFRGEHDVNCPKCDHNFKPGFDNFDPELATKQINSLQEKITKDHASIAHCNEYLEQYTEFKRTVDSVRRIFNDNLVLSPIWDMLFNENIFRVPPMTHIPTLKRVEDYLENLVVVQKLTEQINLNDTIIQSVSSVKGEQDSYNGQHVQQLTDRIDAVIKAKQTLDDSIQVCTRYYRKLSKKTELIQEAYKVKEKLEDLLGNLMLASANQAIAERINTEQMKLATASNTLNNITRHDAVIKEITVEKDKATERLKKLSTIMKALSPTEGLISKYIQNFLDVFIEDVNLIISDIWTTPLEVLTCAVDSTDVNCKFPLSVNEGYTVSADIAEASDGQVDIIDFAFRLTVIGYLGLNDYPLYMDELAPTLDEQHRINIIRYITDLMENHQFDQMFMISHYASNHYAFANADILMLDGRNILEKPARYNHHVNITYNDSLVPPVK